MVDWIDRAQAVQELTLRVALDAQRQAARPSGPSLTHCEECGDEIPAQRQALGSITRCVPCQSTFERENRR